jgi:group I intron endonuclease
MTKKNLYGLPEEEYQTLKSGGIYRITNLKTGKVYIGSTIKMLTRRFACHITNLNKNKHHSPYLQSSWNKYRQENFIFEVIEVCLDNSHEYVNLREQWWLDFYQSYYPDYGYNVNRKADRKTYTQDQKTKVALRKNPEGFLIYESEDDLDPIQVFNLKEYCENKGWNYEACFAVANGRRRSYKKRIIKYADITKNKIQVSEYQKYYRKDYIYLVEDIDPKYYLIEYGDENVDFDYIERRDKKEFRKNVLNKIYKSRTAVSYYRIYFPNNDTIIITDLQEFAKQNNLSASNLTQVAYGQKNHHKNFKCRQVIPKAIPK